MSIIIGVTVGTSISPEKLKEKLDIEPDNDENDGGYYTPVINQPDANTLEFGFSPSNSNLPSVSPVFVTLPSGAGSGNNTNFSTDETLVLKDGILSVNTTDQMEEDNTLPITSAGVYATVGNIEALLKTI